MDFNESYSQFEPELQNFGNENTPDTLEQLRYNLTLNSVLKTALARGARLLARSDPEKADLFRKGIKILRRSSRAQGLRVIATILALNFIFGAAMPLIVSGSSVDSNTSGQPPTLLNAPGDSGNDFQLGVNSANLTASILGKIITVRTEEYVIKVDYSTSFVDYTIRPYFCSDFIRYRRANPQYAGDGTVDASGIALDSVTMTISKWGQTGNTIWFLESCNEFSVNQTFRIYRDYFELDAKYAPGTKNVVTTYFIGLYTFSNNLISLISGGLNYRYVPGIAETTPAGYGLGGWYPSFKMFAPACDIRAPGKTLGLEWGYNETVAYIGAPIWLKDMGGGGDSVFALKYSSMNSVVPNIALGSEKTFHMFVRPYQYTDGKPRGYDVGYAQWVAPKIASAWGNHDTPMFPLAIMDTGTWTPAFRSYVESSQVKLATYSNNPDQINWNYKSAQIAGLTNAAPAQVPISWQVYSSAGAPILTPEGRAVCNPVSGPYNTQGTFRWQLIMNDTEQGWWTSTQAVFWDEMNNWNANNRLRSDYQNRADFVYSGYLELVRDSYRSGNWDFVISNPFTGLLHLAIASDVTLIEGYEPSSIYGEDMIKHVQSTMNFVNNIPSEFRPNILVYQNYATSSAEDQKDVYSVLFGSAIYGYDVELLSYDSYTSQLHNLVMAEEMYKAMGCTRNSDSRIPVATLDLLSASTAITNAQMVVTRGSGRPVVTFTTAYSEHKISNLWSTTNTFDFVIPSTAYYQAGSGVSQVGGVIYSTDGSARFTGTIGAEKTGSVVARSDLAISQLTSGTANITLISKDSSGASLRVSATGGTTQITLKGLSASTMYDLKVNSIKVDSKMTDANGVVVFSRSFGSNDAVTVALGQADVVPPQVQQATPANGAISVLIGSTVEIIFSETMNKASVQGAFSLRAASLVTGAFTWYDSDRRLVFDPSSDLGYNTAYTLALTTAAQDVAGNALTSQLSSGFTTEAYVPVNTVPSAPSSVSASDGLSKVTLNWSPPANDGGSPVSGYLIYRSDSPGQEGITPLITLGNVLSYIDSGLANGATYYYKVSARNAVGIGALSSEVQASCFDVPDPPSSVSASGSANQISLTWSAPSSDGGSAITSYRVYASSSPGAEQFLVAISGTSYVDVGLANGTTHYYKVAAVNGVGEGQQSIEASATTNSFAPSSPGPLIATSMDGAVILSWAQPSSDGGSPITGFNIMRGNAAGGEVSLVTVQPSLSYSDTTVQNGATYYYQVAALNAVGAGPLSNEASATPIGRPSAPTSLTAEPGQSSVSLCWQSPLSTGGSPIISYNVYRGTVSGQLSYLASSTALSYVDLTVSPGATYLYSVSAVNSVGEGVRCEEAPVVAGFVPSVPLNLTISVSNTTIALDWDAPSNDHGFQISSYRVYRSIGELQFILIVEVDDCSAVDSGLMYGQSYRYRVSAVNSVGEGLPSTVVSATPVTCPSQPLNLVAIGGYRQISLTWQAPTLDGGAVVSSYNVYRSQSAQGTMALVATVGNSLQYVDSGLADSTIRFYQVRACTSVGEGPSSDSANGTTYGLPSAPVNLGAMTSDRLISLSWSAPNNDGGSPVVSYQIYRSVSSGPMEMVAELPTTTWEDQAVNYGIEYTYVVKAMNCVGEGPSVTVTIKVPGIPPTAPIDLMVDVSGSQMNLTWQAPENNGGGEIVSYTIYRGTSLGSEEPYIDVDAGTTYDDANVTAGVTYYYKVAARNQFGMGERSTGVSAGVALPLPPSSPPQVMLKLKGQGAQITWTAADGKGSTIVAYNIYRGIASGPVSLIATVSSGCTYYDSNLGVYTRYNYQVSATSAAGEGDLSKMVSINAGVRPNHLRLDTEYTLDQPRYQSPYTRSTVPVSGDSTNTVDIIDGVIIAPRTQSVIQGSVMIGGGVLSALAIITAVFSLTRSHSPKKKSFGEKDLIYDNSSNDVMVVSIERAMVDAPATGSENEPGQKKRNAIDIEFENALEELASMSRY